MTARLFVVLSCFVSSLSVGSWLCHCGTEGELSLVSVWTLVPFISGVNLHPQPRKTLTCCCSYYPHECVWKEVCFLIQNHLRAWKLQNDDAHTTRSKTCFKPLFFCNKYVLYNLLILFRKKSLWKLTSVLL